MNYNYKELRIIETARTIERINQAVREGLRPIVKKVEPSDKIRSKFKVLQNKRTKEIDIIFYSRPNHRDLTSFFDFQEENEYEILIDWTYFYPYKFKSPIAAYLVPKDIEIGERVFIIDLIEDYVESPSRLDDIAYRLRSCEAIWNGEEFEIHYNPEDLGDFRYMYIG